MPLFLNDAEVASLVDMQAIITALENAFGKEARGEAFNLPRHRLRKHDARLNLMLAGDSVAGRYAIRAYGSLGVSISHVYLYGGEGLLAVLEARTLSALRTGAASAVAAKRLAKPDARIVGIIGTGRQAESQLAALLAVRPITEVRVFARDRTRLEDFCARMSSQLAVSVRAASSAQAAAENADIVVTATSATEPVLFANWLKPGACVVAMGANAASRREVEPAIVTGAEIIATDDPLQAKTEAAEFIDLGGAFDWSKLIPLNSLVANPPVLKGGFTLFKSLGAGIEDLASASLVYDRALKRRAPGA